MSDLKREIIIIDPMRASSTNKLRVAAYCRVSSDSEDQLESFAAQVDYYTKLIAQCEDWQMVDIYADEGISALSTSKRDDFNRLMKDCRKGKIDIVLAKSISRFSRNTKDCLVHIRELKSLGISVRFEKENLNTAEIGGEMLLTMYSGMAQQESMSISGNMRWSYEKRMQSGNFITCKAPFGYRFENETLVVDDREAEMVRQIFHSYLHGKSIAELVRAVQEQGFITRDGKEKWQTSAILYILKNERYQGSALLQKKYTTDTLPFRKKHNKGEKGQYYVEHSHAPIVEAQTFKAVQRVIAERAILPKAPRQQYTFTRKIICAECGTPYRRSVDKTAVRWVCRKHHTYGNTACTAKPITELMLEQAFIKMYNKLRPAAQNILGTMADQLCALKTSRNIGNTQIAEINKQLASLTEQNHVMNDLMVKSLIDSAFFISQSTELNRQILKLKRDKVMLMEQDDEDELLANIHALLDIFEDSPTVITEFDADLFGQITDKAIINSNETIRFRLIGGLELPETIERGI